MSKVIKSIKIKNRLLVPTLTYLNTITNLSSKASREKVRFNRLLIERLEEFDPQKLEIMKKYCNLDKDGNPKIIKSSKLGPDKKPILDKDKKPVILEEFDVKSDEDEKKFSEDWKEYMEEDLVIDLLDGNKEKIYVVADIVLNNEKVAPQFETINEALCEIFEALPRRQEV